MGAGASADAQPSNEHVEELVSAFRQAHPERADKLLAKLQSRQLALAGETGAVEAGPASAIAQPATPAAAEAPAPKLPADHFVLFSNLSDVSKHAFWVVNHFVRKADKEKDKITLLHTYNKAEGDESSQNNKPEHVVKQLEGWVFKAETRSTDALSSRVPRVSFTVAQRERAEGAKLHETACEFVDDVKADFLCIGSGHCNRKETLGSVAYNALKHLQTTTSFPAMFIVRSQFRDDIETPPHKMKFLLAMDGGETSEHMFTKLSPYKKNTHFVLLSILTDAADSVAESAQAKCKRLLADAGVEGEAMLVRKHGGSQKVSELVIKAADDVDADVIALGVKRKGGAQLGSVSKAVIKKSVRHVMIVHYDANSMK